MKSPNSADPPRPPRPSPSHAHFSGSQLSLGVRQAARCPSLDDPTSLLVLRHSANAACSPRAAAPPRCRSQCESHSQKAWLAAHPGPRSAARGPAAPPRHVARARRPRPPAGGSPSGRGHSAPRARRIRNPPPPARQGRVRAWPRRSHRLRGTTAPLLRAGVGVPGVGGGHSSGSDARRSGAPRPTRRGLERPRGSGRPQPCGPRAHGGPPPPCVYTRALENTGTTKTRFAYPPKAPAPFFQPGSAAAVEAEAVVRGFRPTLGIALP